MKLSILRNKMIAIFRYKKGLTREQLQEQIENSDLSLIDVFWASVKATENKFIKEGKLIPENFPTHLKMLLNIYEDGQHSVKLMLDDPSINQITSEEHISTYSRGITRINDVHVKCIIETIASARLKLKITK